MKKPQTTSDDPMVLEIAKVLHIEYEKKAKEVGWKTQEDCQVTFKELPAKNKRVMILMAKVVIELMNEEVRRESGLIN